MTALLAAIHFVCPLLFFTDLTRNPYFTQIALVNIGLAAAGLWWAIKGFRAGRWTWVSTPLDIPWTVTVAAAALSWLVAYRGHAAFYTESIESEGLRNAVFLLVNCLLVYFLAAQSCQGEPGDPDVSVGGWTAFALAWGGAWTLFPQLRENPGMVTALWPHIWDPFGALMWAAGLAAVLWLSRRGRTHDMWHVILVTGFLGAVYGVCQYFGVEFFWPKTLNPYGGRSVSTFGNPNFMSSYMLMLLPLAVAYYLHAASRLARAAYAVVFLFLEASLLCSLTRSSWVGAAAALAPLALSPKLRRLARQDLEFHGLAAAAAVALAAFWPQSAVEGYAPSVVGRLSEMAQAFKTSAGGGVYSPLHQRLLIWLCAWTMGAENPLTGKGFGLIELFYPFYQGHYLLAIDSLRSLRTHANNAHNELLETFSQTGILGLGAALLLWTAFYRRIWSALTAGRPADPAPKGKGARPEDESEPVWALAAAAGTVGMLVDNLLNVSLHFAVPGLLFWWQAGTAMGILSRREYRTAELAPSRPAAVAVLAAALAAAGFVGRHWTGQWMREALYFTGFKFMRRGDSRGASELLERAYRWHSREVNTNYELGNAYARSDLYEKAVWAYQEALNANAGYDEIYFNIATILSLRLNRRDEAIDRYRVSWAINPVAQATTGNYASSLLQRAGPGDREEAEGVLAWGVQLFPEDMNMAMTLASLEVQSGSYAKAETVLEGLLQRQPNLAPAETVLRQALAKSGRPAPAVLGRVAAFHKLEELIGRRDYGDEALRLARAAAADFPSSTAAVFYLGNLELIHGDAAAAARLLSQALQGDPRNLGARLNLAQAYRRLGRRDEAMAQFRAVLAEDPNNASARAGLASP